MSDLIDRNAALDAVTIGMSDRITCMVHTGIIIDRIKALPAMDPGEVPTHCGPKRKPARLLTSEDSGTIMYECSACNARMIARLYDEATGTKAKSYCPYCGARWVVEHE